MTDLIVDFAEKDPDLPEVGNAPTCCDAPNLEVNYGLAGGGIGVYEFCLYCERVVSKTVEEEE